MCGLEVFFEGPYGTIPHNIGNIFLFNAFLSPFSIEIVGGLKQPLKSLSLSKHIQKQPQAKAAYSLCRLTSNMIKVMGTSG